MYCWWYTFVGPRKRQAVIEDKGNVDVGQDDQVETQAITVKPKRFKEVEVGEEGHVEHEEHPTAETEQQKNGQQSVKQQNERLAVPKPFFLFGVVVAHKS